MIGLNPTLGDPVLGPVGWDKRFRTGIIGLTRMEVPHLTVIGLPARREVHLALYNYDNSVGLGGCTFIADKEPTVRIPIYAGWSDGKHEPPARLEALTAHLEQSGQTAEKLLGFEPDWNKDYFDYVWQHAHKDIDLPGFGQAKVVDVLAAESYRQLRKSHAQRLERLHQRQQPTDTATK